MSKKNVALVIAGAVVVASAAYCICAVCDLYLRFRSRPKKHVPKTQNIIRNMPILVRPARFSLSLAIPPCERICNILSALETDAPDAIAMHRTTASGRWINFHTDAAARTVQVSARTPGVSSHHVLYGTRAT